MHPAPTTPSIATAATRLARYCIVALAISAWLPTIPLSRRIANQRRPDMGPLRTLAELESARVPSIVTHFCHRLVRVNRSRRPRAGTLGAGAAQDRGQLQHRAGHPDPAATGTGTDQGIAGAAPPEAARCGATAPAPRPAPRHSGRRSARGPWSPTSQLAAHVQAELPGKGGVAMLLWRSSSAILWVHLPRGAA